MISIKLKSNSKYILSKNIYIEGDQNNMDLGIVILISKFPNLCHDMKAYPRI